MKYISWIVIIGSFALFQIHSGFAWVEITGSDAGWAWSIMFELSAIYFWSRKETTLGILASIVVLCMASYNISKNTRTTLTTGVNDRAIILVENTLENISDKAYPITIQKTMAHLSDLKSTNKIETSGTKEKALWIGIALQIIALGFILLAQIKAIIFIRDTEVKVKVKSDTNCEVIESNTDTDSQEVVFAKELIMNFTSYIRANGNISVNALLNLLHIDGELNLPGNTYGKIVTTAKGEGGIGLNKMKQIEKRLKDIQS